MTRGADGERREMMQLRAGFCDSYAMELLVYAPTVPYGTNADVRITSRAAKKKGEARADSYGLSLQLPPSPPPLPAEYFSIVVFEIFN